MRLARPFLVLTGSTPRSFSTTSQICLPYRTPRGTSRKSRRAIRLKHSGVQYSLTHAPPSFLQPFQQSNNAESSSILFPKEIVAHLDKLVVGQSDAKRSLAVGVYQHFRRLENNEKALTKWAFAELRLRGPAAEDEERTPPQKKSQRQILKEIQKREDILLEKANIVLMGPSGTGKTYITQKLAEILDVPLVVCDCTTLTQAGYVGDDVDTVIQKLFEAADYDVDRCQRGIVFLDEFDKLYTSADPMHTAGNRDVGGKGVQQALLKLVEGTSLRIKDPLQSKRKVEIDTTNILFIASGAFSNIERVVARRIEKRTLGFGGMSTESIEKLDGDDERISSKVKDELLRQCDQGDMIRFGMIPELVGRFPVIVPFHSLDESHLMNVLSEPRGNLVSQAQRYFQLDDIELTFSKCALQEIAKIAAQRKTGARALKSIVEKTLIEAKYELPGTTTRAVRVTAKTVRGQGYQIVDDTVDDDKLI
ncbi:unnamed protein product [Caenorhabditis auriculariae]|uniref:AAA+ ATPase domain-containing protein n=1 Tax=Caenorhabditis auriculariae TaxID=2777116 RepID=A0A8S1GNC9_9PELO|nr:unnamed protein product [Caenorhabditis auriculariae]